MAQKLPEKKMPSTAAKATSLSAYELSDPIHDWNGCNGLQEEIFFCIISDIGVNEKGVSF
jgi:hypothetical protein